MKASFQWLQEYVRIPADPEACSQRLTMAGLEVGKIESVGGDTVFEIEITPNRPDCLNHIGIAREAAAIFNKPLRLPNIKKIKPPKKKCAITITDRKDCARYIGAVLKNVSVQQSPRSRTTRLEAVGVRAVNNIVDITNFCLMEMGQPMHAFDYDKLVGGEVIVRRARAGERIVAIDGIEYALDESILIIADQKGPVAIAGVMGGKGTEVTESTKNILLESAYFDPIVVRRGARRLGLSTDSSYRFERGVNIEGVESGSERAVALIINDAGGTPTAFTDAFPGKNKKKPTVVRVTKNQVDSLLGMPVPLSRCAAILKALGFGVSTSKHALTVRPPSFRRDITQSVDVIEDIARIIGFDVIPETLPQAHPVSGFDNEYKNFKDALANLLAAQGLSEVISYSLASCQSLEKTGIAKEKLLSVVNPLTTEQEAMRPSLLPSMLPVAALNINKGQKDLSLFEIGKVYDVDGEHDTIGILMTGVLSEDWRRGKPAADIYDLKGIVQAVCERFGTSAVAYVPGDAPYATAGQHAVLTVAGERAGWLGSISSQVLESWGIKHKGIIFAQVDCEVLFTHSKRSVRYQPAPAFPAIVRDISFAVKNYVPFNEIEAVIRTESSALLSSIDFVEQYIGEKIPDGHRGLVLSLTYQSLDRTLREEEVAQLHGRICQALVEALGAIIR